MATTIKVDGTVADFTWQDDQLLDPLDDVDLVRLSTDLTTGSPESAGGGGDSGGGGTASVTLTSSSFTAGGAIASRFYYDQSGCPGSNDSPQLSWSFKNLPDGATLNSWSLAVIDPDGGDWVHWTVSDIPSTQTSIAENGSWDAGATVGQTSYDPAPARANGWAGPCPPPGETHTYNIRIVAQYTDSQGAAQTLESTTLSFTATNTNKSATAKKSDPFSMTKGQLRQLAKENGFDSAVAKEVWQLPLAALRQAIADALRMNQGS